MVCKTVTAFLPFVVHRQAAGHPADVVRPGGEGVVYLRQRPQILRGIAYIVGPAAEHLVRYDDKVITPGGEAFQPGQNGLGGVLSCPAGAVKLVGDEVAEVFQQDGPPARQSQTVEVERAFQRFELLLRPHFPVLFHPGGALGIPDLHGGEIIAGQAGLKHKALGVGTLAAGRAAEHQRQHPSPSCGV